MKKRLQELKQKFANNTVFIVAGGPSINNIDISLLDDKLTIAINNSYQIVPNATALYWCDSSWVGKHLDYLNHHKCKLRFHARHGMWDNNGDVSGIANSTILSRTSEFGFDENPNHVCGNNSGAHAINLAVNMGASTIVLLGFDMKYSNSKTHWHAGHGYGMRPMVYTDSFIPSIMSMAKRIKELRLPVKIVNVSDDSALKCFATDTFDNYI